MTWTRWPVAAAIALLMAVTVACSGGAAGSRPAAERKEVVPPKIEVSPADGAKKARPEKGVVVTATGGTLETVSVQMGKKKVDGGFNDERTEWKADGTLMPSKSFTVTATAKSPSGGTAEVSSSFKTITPKNPLAVADVTPTSGEKVGVGMPIIVRFNREVKRRAAVERALKVESEEPTEGAWRWMSGSEVIYRTKKYWKPHQKVTLDARIAGVKAAKDVYGAKNHKMSFEIGREQISTVNTKSHRMKVKIGGKTVKNVGISAGRGGKIKNGVDVYLTASGPHLTMSKHRVERMTSEWMGVDPKDKKNGGYDLKLPWAVRISNTGEYVHAMNNLWAQGSRNVSHGCVNSPPAFAKWFYSKMQRGDVVDVTGSKRKLPWNNGWSYWVLSYSEWKKGSALD